MKWEIEMKLRRSDRMVVISNYLINNPYKLTSLNTFAEKYESAKSSISEDIVIIKRAFEEIEIGHIQTVTGAGGGVIFTPSISSQDAKEMVEDLRAKLSESDRILPGGYIYLSDLLSTPAILKILVALLPRALWTKKLMRYDRSDQGCATCKCSCQCPQCSFCYCAP